MLFIPQEKVKKTLKRLREEGRERRRKETLKRREEYLKAKENNDLDSYFKKHNTDFDF